MTEGVWGFHHDEREKRRPTAKSPQSSKVISNGFVCLFCVEGH